MTTDIVSVNEEYFKKRVFELGKIIREGGLVSFPTETVYGLGANALDAEAAEENICRQRTALRQPPHCSCGG